jgi:DNA-binding response OmpR family regulator
VPRRVLVAEDDDMLRAVVAEYLIDEGFEVQAARDGAEALRLAREQTPDVAVLDASMPVMDARATLNIWEQDDALRSIPVILVSAKPGLVALARQLAVRASLAKPFDLDVLHAIIDQLLAHPEPPPDLPTVPAD